MAAKSSGKQRGPGRPFQKGQSGNPRGRKPGAVNKVTAEAKAACAAIVDDPIYRSMLLKRAQLGRLAPAVEAMLWHYAKGKPKEHVEVSGVDGQPINMELVVSFIGAKGESAKA